MSESESQRNAQKAPEPPKVHIDRKGRLSVKTSDLAKSEVFRARLSDMAKLADTLPPKT